MEKIPRKSYDKRKSEVNSLFKDHLTELLDFIRIQFYSELHLAARPDARPLLQEARHDMATEGPEALAGPQSQEASGSSPLKALLVARGTRPRSRSRGLVPQLPP